MREILFRGKRVDNGKWITGYYFHYETCHEHFIITDMSYDMPVMEQVIPETVGQYTGLTDKNGKKIFEGDIIAIDEDSIYYHTAAGPVRTYKGMWVSFYLPDAHGRDCYDELYRINSEREVIGNIHDNPELLQEDKQ